MIRHFRIEHRVLNTTRPRRIEIHDPAYTSTYPTHPRRIELRGPAYIVPSRQDPRIIMQMKHFIDSPGDDKIDARFQELAIQLTQQH